MFCFFEIGTALVECVLTHFLFNAWFGRRSIPRWFFLSGLMAYFIVNCIYTLIPILPIVRTLCAAATFYLVCLLLYNASPLLSIAGAMVNLVVNVVVEYLALVILGYLGFDMGQLMNIGPERVGYIVIAKLLNIIVILTVSAMTGHRRLRLGVSQIIPLCVCQIISIYICQVFYKTSTSRPDILSSYILVLLGVMYINTVMILFIENLTVAAKAKQETALAEQNYLLQKTYYEAVQEDQASTHALWHDIKKYVLAIEAVASTGDKESMLENIGLIKESFSQIGNLVDVGNQEANVILNHCIQKANVHGIRVNLDVMVPPGLDISAIDLSVIIGNTFDNAIEECLRLSPEWRSISVELKQNNSMLLYVIENPCLPQPEKKVGTTHGYGLRNVQSCVEKYNGTLNIEKTNGYYRVLIRLNVTTKDILTKINQ